MNKRRHGYAMGVAHFHSISPCEEERKKEGNWGEKSENLEFNNTNNDFHSFYEINGHIHEYGWLIYGCKENYVANSEISSILRIHTRKQHKTEL